MNALNNVYGGGVQTYVKIRLPLSDLRYDEYPSKKDEPADFSDVSIALRDILILSESGEREMILRIILQFCSMHHF